MKVIKAPDKYNHECPLVFLSGSIDEGKAKLWAEVIEDELREENVTLLNPRRDDWDSSWVQSKDFWLFRKQVEWELKGMEDADIILVHFEIDSASPITLMELGLFKDKVVVHCPEGFYRKGNVDIVCDRYNIPQVDSLKALASAALSAIS